MMRWAAMGKCWILILLLMVATIIVVHQSGVVECCVEQERLALLQLKAYINSYSNPEYAENPWLDNEDRNCCEWDEVRCNVFTGHVTKLLLSEKTGRVYDEDEKKWLFNVTLFRPFSHLIYLDLSYNNINGLVEEDGSTNILTLKNLRVLKLSGNNFQKGYISVSVLTSLRSLSLDDNKRLNLSSIQIVQGGLNESSFPISRELPNLSKLQILDLSGNSFSYVFQGNWLSELRNLRELYLEKNYIEGNVPASLCNLTSLQVLLLGVNHIKGRVPTCLHNLSSLQTLDLSANRITELPDLSNLKSLQSLYLSDNQIEGNLSFYSLVSNLSNLQDLALSENNIHVHVEDALLLRPISQFQSLDLGGCYLNPQTIPKFLWYQYNLTFLDLSNNDLVGPFPTWLLNNNSQLKELYLGGNSFSGYLHLPKPHGLETLNISSNQLRGELPTSIGFVFPNLERLIMSANSFQGQIPSSLSRLDKLEVLAMSRNNFSGELPYHFLSNCSKLTDLLLSHNNLQGKIIPDDMYLPSLEILNLNNNNFGGTIGEAILKSSNTLLVLDISNNKVAGELPDWIDNFSYLEILAASNNSLQGPIPPEICNRRFIYLGLSGNNFTGTIPSCSNFSSLQSLQLHNNNLKGLIPKVLSKCSKLEVLALGDNQLMGNIPRWINKLVNLRVLQLGGNQLHGQIPFQMCELGNLDILDLSRNNLSGVVPACFKNVSFGKVPITDEIIDPTMNISTYTYVVQEAVEVLVKNDYLSYKGGLDLHMSDLDISCNKLTGFIPSELGELEHIQSLNLSHNLLTGSIPTSFSNLKHIESLDLSFNNLCGEIPSQLVELNTLEIFNVSYNKLTGRVPVGGQFGSFIEDSYFRNPGLYGFPGSDLHNQTNSLQPNNTTTAVEAGTTFIVDFFWSFGATFAVMFLATVAIIYINPQWRQACFDFVDRYLLWWLPMSWRLLY